MNNNMAKIAKKVNSNKKWNSPEFKWTETKVFGIPISHKPKKDRDTDSRSELEAMGITIVSEDDRFYTCELPPGWTTTRDGYWTTYFDADRVEKMSQFDKFSSYDSHSHVSF